MNKMVRCLACGESFDVEESVVPVKGEPVCPTCDNDNFIDIDEEGEEEEVMCTCKFCGDDFECDEDLEVCPDCYEAIKDSGNEDLILALADEFSCCPTDIVNRGYGEWQVDGMDIRVVDEDGVSDLVREYIEDTVWTFPTWFIADCTELPTSLFEALAENGRCESNNDALVETIERTCGMEEFVDSAINADGLTHFIEDRADELYVKGTYYYVIKD